MIWIEAIDSQQEAYNPRAFKFLQPEVRGESEAHPPGNKTYQVNVALDERLLQAGILRLTIALPQRCDIFRSFF